MNKNFLTLVLLTVATSVYTADASKPRIVTITNNSSGPIVVCSGQSLGSKGDKKIVVTDDNSTLHLRDNSLMISTNNASAYAPSPSIVDLPIVYTHFSITFDNKHQVFTVTPVK